MTEYVYESKPAVIEQPRSVPVRIAALGVFLGLVVWALAYALERFVLSRFLCGGDVVCQQSTLLAGNIASVVVALAGVVVLVRMSVYRPLLIALGAVISLWGMAAWLDGVSVLEAVGWTVLLYTLAYSAFAWIARIRHVAVLLVVFIVLVVATRVVPLLV